MPARPRGLLEPCAATSGKHGSEEGGAGKRHPLSDTTVSIGSYLPGRRANVGLAWNLQPVTGKVRPSR
jgi:hypothetical protein